MGAPESAVWDAVMVDACCAMVLDCTAISAAIDAILVFCAAMLEACVVMVALSALTWPSCTPIFVIRLVRLFPFTSTLYPKWGIVNVCKKIMGKTK